MESVIVEPVDKQRHVELEIWIELYFLVNCNTLIHFDKFSAKTVLKLNGKIASKQLKF